MLHTTNIISQHRSTLHCVWVPTHSGADAPLAAVWIYTPQSDSRDPEHRERPSDGRCGTQQHVTGSSTTSQAMERRTGECKLQTYRELSELIDPRRSIDGSRLSYNGKALLPVSYECDWMVSNHMLQRAVTEQLLALAMKGTFAENEIGVDL